jgi:hypothetical protein
MSVTDADFSGSTATLCVALSLRYAYENRSTKDVRAFEGEVAFKDILGNNLAQIPLKVLNPLRAGEKGSVTARHYFMAYRNLEDKKLDDVKIEWKPQKILFADGTSAPCG